MTDPASSWLARYQPWRRRAEIGFWVAVLLVQLVFNTNVTWIDVRRAGIALAWWEPLAWEATSNLAVGLLIPVIAAFERRFPLRWASLPRNLLPHLVGSLLFCLAHVALMMAPRFGIYALMDSSYRPGNLATQLVYEYLKDVRSYVLILAAILSYRFLLLRAQGEARLLDFLEQLDPARFARVHRSYAVNLDRVAEIESTEGGDARLKMKDGSQVPCSRRYREALGGPT